MEKEDPKPAVIPRCLAALSLDTVRKIKKILNDQKGQETELDSAIDQLIKLVDESVKK